MQNIPTLITLQEIYNNCITRSMLILADMLEQKKCNIDEKMLSEIVMAIEDLSVLEQKYAERIRQENPKSMKECNRGYGN